MTRFKGSMRRVKLGTLKQTTTLTSNSLARVRIHTRTRMAESFSIMQMYSFRICVVCNEHAQPTRQNLVPPQHAASLQSRGDALTVLVHVRTRRVFRISVTPIKRYISHSFSSPGTHRVHS